MKILCVCDQGNNRSVHFSHLLKYVNNSDTIPIGLSTASSDTLDMLFRWSDLIVLTEKVQTVPDEFKDKVILCDVGKDTYPRPFNKDLMIKAKQLISKQISPLFL